MTSSNDSKLQSIGFLVFKAIVALAFAAFGIVKLMGMPMLVQEFDTIGLGQGFRIITGLIEVGGAVLLIVPKTFRLGALVLLCVSIGAFIAQATVLHGDVAHTIVLIVITGLLTWLAWRPAVSHAAAEGV